MEHDVVIHKDCLLIPPLGKSIKKKSWLQKCGKLFGASKFGTKRLEIWDQDTKSKTPFAIIQLVNCVKITCDDDTHFTLTLTTAPFDYEFGTLTPASKTKWLSALQCVVFPEDSSVLTSVEEDNELYCSSDDAIFFVTLYPSVVSQRCNIDHNAKYILHLTLNCIELKLCDGTLLYTWPYCFIRRYGYKNNKFTFEAGRKCDSGEGTFFIEHTNQQEIFKCLSTKIKQMKKLNQKVPPAKPPRKSLPVKQVNSYDRVECKLDAWRTQGIDEVTHTENVNEEEEEYFSWGGEPGAKAPVAMATGTAPKIVKQRPVDRDNYNKLNFFGSSSKLNTSSDYKTIAFNEYAEIGACVAEPERAPDINYHFQNNQPYAIINKPKKNN